MKTPKKLSTTKLVAHFDNELKNLLIEDLKNFRTRHQFLNNNNQAVEKQLSAA